MRKGMIAVAVALSACGGGAEKEAQDAVARDLRDPPSAQFRDVKVYPRYVCGEVNGKNGMGAYAGFRRFWYGREKRDFGIDPQSADGDEIARTDQRIFDGSLETFCKDDAR